MKKRFCRGCSKVKPIDRFRKNKGCSDGITHQCKDCHYISQRNGELRRNFGISYAEYLVMLNAQQGRCAICAIKQEDLSKAFAVDHCHHSGKIRGLLCWRCNSSIGRFEEDVELLKRAIEYLQIHKSGQALG